MAVIMIDPEKVEDNPYQPRSHYPRKTIDEIAYSIEQIGIIHVPTGRQVDGHYEIAEGHLRKRAYIKLKKGNPKKFGEMPLDIREISDRDMAIISLEENLRRQDITPLEQARAVDMYLVNFTDVTETALAKTLNMTQGNISNMRRVLKCPDEVLQKIVDGKINFTMARELLIFQEINVGFEKEYRGGKEVNVPKDEKWLMLQAVRGVGGQYGRAATVDGIKRCIYDVAERNLKWLDKQQAWYGHERNPLFDTRAAGCLKCPKMIRAFETKSQARHFCTDSECWDKKQEAHKKQQAAEARKKVHEDIAKRIAAAEVDREKEGGISQEIPASCQGCPTLNACIDSPVWQTYKGNPACPNRGIKPQDGEMVGGEILNEEEIQAVVDEIEEEWSGEEEDLPTFATLDEVCHGCINKKRCERRNRNPVSTPEGTKYACKDRVTKENYQEVREKAKVAMPASFKNLVKDKAGTPATSLESGPS